LQITYQLLIEIEQFQAEWSRSELIHLKSRF
jgi:hypothetical protein